jgi:hypothetical protein
MCTKPWSSVGRVEAKLHALTLELDGGKLSATYSGRFALQYPLNRKLCDSQSRSDGGEKTEFQSSTGNWTQAVRSVAGNFTDLAVLYSHLLWSWWRCNHFDEEISVEITEQ